MRPVITIDGPSGTGKGTISAMLAEHLGWHVLDSGALYRVLGLAAERAGVDLEDESALMTLAAALPLEFQGKRVLFEGADVSDEIRSEQVSGAASRVAAHPGVRQALLQWQRRQAQPPGLVADGRDMGTIVFPVAQLKFYLDASAEIRAERRYKQLKEKGMGASLQNLTAAIYERDTRDRTRAVAPLCAAEDAIVIDTSHLSVAEVFEQVLGTVLRVLPEAVDG